MTTDRRTAPPAWTMESKMEGILSLRKARAIDSSGSDGSMRSSAMPRRGARLQTSSMDSRTMDPLSVRSKYTPGPAIRIPYYKNMGKDLALEGPRICPCLGRLLYMPCTLLILLHSRCRHSLCRHSLRRRLWCGHRHRYLATYSTGSTDSSSTHAPSSSPPCSAERSTVFTSSPPQEPPLELVTCCRRHQSSTQ